MSVYNCPFCDVELFKHYFVNDIVYSCDNTNTCIAYFCYFVNDKKLKYDFNYLEPTDNEHELNGSLEDLVCKLKALKVFL